MSKAKQELTLETLDTFNLDNDSIFTLLLKTAVDKLQITPREASLLVSVSVPTMRRWLAGTTHPHPMVRRIVLEALLKLLPDSQEELEKIRGAFFKKVWELVDYWSGSQVNQRNTRERIAGFAHSLCATIAGCATDHPPMEIRVIRSDYETGEQIGVSPDFGAGLNGFLYRYEPKRLPQ